MTDDGGKREYVFVRSLRPYVIAGAGGILLFVALAAFGAFVIRDEDIVRFQFMALLAVLIAAALAWTLIRNLVLRATLERGRLRANTVLARHDIAVEDLREIAWRVDESRFGGLNPLNDLTARLRYRWRTLRVPMPAGAPLLRDLEAARSALGAAPPHEFDYSALVHAPSIGPTTIRHATLDDRALRAVTGDGREHEVPLDSITDVDDPRDPGTGGVTVRHRAGELRIAVPVGVELADRLLAARAGGRTGRPTAGGR
jgi:hypothetical protein